MKKNANKYDETPTKAPADDLYPDPSNNNVNNTQIQIQISTNKIMNVNKCEKECQQIHTIFSRNKYSDSIQHLHLSSKLVLVISF